MAQHKVLVGGQWREAAASQWYEAEDPATRESLPGSYPVSRWEDCEAALDCAAHAAVELRSLSPQAIAHFLETYAQRIEMRAGEIVAMAHGETALPVSPRLADIELPRTTGQLRQAAAAAREGSWSLPVIDSQAGIRSVHGPLGPVCVFGPNNFPLAFNSIAGGDFAAAIAAGNPVIAKANTSHPGTTRLLAEEALEAATQAGMPAGVVQLLYRLPHEDGKRLVADRRVGATGYTGSRQAGLKLKAAADAAGKPIYLELSSVNPVIVLGGALQERLEEIADEFTTSCLMGTGQFCTNPGIVVLPRSEWAESFVAAVAGRFQSAPTGTLLSRGVAESLRRGLASLQQAGAEQVVGGTSVDGDGTDGDGTDGNGTDGNGTDGNGTDGNGTDGNGTPYCCANSLLRVSGTDFLAHPAELQAEAFGNASLFVLAEDIVQICEIAEQLEGNLTGCFYTARDGSDDRDYDQIAPFVRQRVGRLINDKMPTGVAVSAAMNHGGPFPATGHPGFTAVGIPASLRRFSMLQCYDNVRPQRLPASLQDANPNGVMWRSVDGQWTQADVLNPEVKHGSCFPRNP